MPETNVKVAEVRPGDLINLEGDRYADPDGSDVHYQYEYAVVEEVERETDECILITFDVSAVGFPPDHILRREEDR